MILSRDPVYTRICHSARYLNARWGVNANFPDNNSLINATGWAVEQGAEVLNFSLAISSNSTGNALLSRFSDWIVSEQKIPIAAAAHNNFDFEDPSNLVWDSGAAFNVLTVGASSSRSTLFDRVADYSRSGTQDGRLKPDVIAPGANITTNAFWETQPDFEDIDATSRATCHGTGMMTLQIGYGKTHSLSTDPLVLKATMMNSAEKIKKSNNMAWDQTNNVSSGVTYIIRPLDVQSGSGQSMASNCSTNTPPASMASEAFLPSVGTCDITGNTSVDYAIDSPPAIWQHADGDTDLEPPRHPNRRRQRHHRLQGPVQCGSGSTISISPCCAMAM